MCPLVHSVRCGLAPRSRLSGARRKSLATPLQRVDTTHCSGGRSGSQSPASPCCDSSHPTKTGLEHFVGFRRSGSRRWPPRSPLRTPATVATALDVGRLGVMLNGLDRCETGTTLLRVAFIQLRSSGHRGEKLRKTVFPAPVSSLRPRLILLPLRPRWPACGGYAPPLGN